MQVRESFASAEPSQPMLVQSSCLQWWMRQAQTWMAADPFLKESGDDQLRDLMCKAGLLPQFSRQGAEDFTRQTRRNRRTHRNRGLCIYAWMIRSKYARAYARLLSVFNPLEETLKEMVEWNGPDSEWNDQDGSSNEWWHYQDSEWNDQGGSSNEWWNYQDSEWNDQGGSSNEERNGQDSEWNDQNGSSNEKWNSVWHDQDGSANEWWNHQDSEWNDQGSSNEEWNGQDLDS